VAIYFLNCLILAENWTSFDVILGLFVLFNYHSSVLVCPELPHYVHFRLFPMVFHRSLSVMLFSLHLLSGVNREAYRIWLPAGLVLLVFRILSCYRFPCNKKTICICSVHLDFSCISLYKLVSAFPLTAFSFDRLSQDSHPFRDNLSYYHSLCTVFSVTLRFYPYFYFGTAS